MSTKTGELAIECKRMSESCLFSSTTFFVWLKFLGAAKFVFTVVPLVLGSLATWSVLTASDQPGVKLFIGVCAFVAGVLPTVYSALKYDEYLATCKQLAGEFKNLQDAFRRCATVSSKKPFKEFEAEASVLFARLERARSLSVTPPEFFFKRAQRKIKTGDYDFDVDLNMKEIEGSNPQ